MGRIVASVEIENPADPNARIRCDAVVNTGSSFMLLPSAWRDRLGKLEDIGKIQLETATQETVEGEVCGPTRIQIGGFRPIYNEVLFVDMWRYPFFLPAAIPHHFSQKKSPAPSRSQNSAAGRIRMPSSVRRLVRSIHTTIRRLILG